MNKPLKMYFNWSSGKDASLALYHLQNEGKYQIDHLLTSINSHYDRVSMHGLRRELLEAQADAIDLRLTTIELPKEPTMDQYNQLMRKAVNQFKTDGYTSCGFGDIFLEDLRKYREEQLKPLGISAHFPLWKKDTKQLISEFISLGFKAIVVCVKAESLDETFVGRDIDADFIDDLPPNVDPCGENGEFHTFCYEGPIFKTPIQFTIGEKVYKEYKAPKGNHADQDKKTMGFWFCDLLLAKGEGSR
ncbi:MAG: ATP-binding protein [Flavobacteriaceae bacterium]